MSTIKFSNIVPAVLAALSLPYHSIVAHSTTGPYAVTTSSLPVLASRTIYAPSNLSTVTDPIPLLIWANNACDPTTLHDPYAPLNAELASYGAVVLACGSGAAALHSLTAAQQESWTNVNTAQVGMLGTSCGGVEVYTAAEDERVLSLAVLDTGTAATEESRQMAANATKPVFFFSAGIAGTNSPAGLGVDGGVKADFEAVAKGVPSWFGVLPGVDGEMGEAGAGKMGRAGRFWAQWMVSGEQTGSEFFVDASGAESEGWTVERKGMEVLVL